MKLLIINPGGASTKIAVFENEEQVFKKNIIHTQEESSRFSHVFDQFGCRKGLVLKTLEEEGADMHELSGVAERGGLMNSIPGGTYRVNERMLEDLEHAVHGEHPSNLGAALARSIGDQIGIPSFVVDLVSVGELMPKTGMSGISDLERPSWFHALGHKAMARWAAERIGKKYKEGSLIIAHLDSGNSVVAHKNGQMTDESGDRTNGSSSSERNGGLPTYPLVELCYSGEYTREEMVTEVSSTGDMHDYPGTKDAGEVERRMRLGDETARLVYEAFVYMVAKEVCSYAAAFEGKVDCIVLMGGIVHSRYVTDGIRRMVGFPTPVEVVAGEFEMTALALGALRVLKGEEEPGEYE